MPCLGLVELVYTLFSKNSAIRHSGPTPEPKTRHTKILGKSQISLTKLNKDISREELKQMIRTMSFLAIGKELGVSDNAIRKWCKKYNLPYKKKDIKSYSDEEWGQL